ncbi:MAG: Pycsar system effector family protein [Bacteroidota bacterium]
MSNIVDKVQSFATRILKEELPEEIHFHTYSHTRNVVESASKIADSIKLEEAQKEVVVISAWMHNIGFAESIAYHKEMSIQKARLFLYQNGYPADRITQVVQCIRSTKIPQKPKSDMEKVLCDADLAHLSYPNFPEITESLRQEVCSVDEIHVSKREWLLTNEIFFKEHQYFTDFANNHFLSRKEQNLVKLQKEIAQAREDGEYIEALEEKEKTLKKRLKSEKSAKPDKGIETMIRVTSKNHIKLSQMADNKANILISVNAIILSVIVSVLVRKFEESPHLIIPTIILVITCLIAIVFAVLSTRPNVSRGKFTRHDIENRKTNLLFFGNFHGTSMEDYLWGMKEMMKSGEYLYSSLIKDIYFIGRVLGRKYKLLRISYLMFMFGLIISVMSFLLAGYLRFTLN